MVIIYALIVNFGVSSELRIFTIKHKAPKDNNAKSYIYEIVN